MGSLKKGTALSVLALLSLIVPLAGSAADQAAVSAAPETITLAQFVDQALAGGPDIRISQNALGTAQAAYSAGVAGNALRLSGSLSANQTSPLVPSGSGSLAATGSVDLTGPLGLDVGVTATQPITESAQGAGPTKVGVTAGVIPWDGYPGGKALADVQQATLAFQGVQLTQDNQRKTIVYNVKQAYYTLLAQQRQIRILQSTLAQRQEEMKKTQALFNAQSANQIDLKQAQVNQRQAELDLLKAQDTLEVSRQKLSALVGWPLDKVYTVAEEQDLPVPDMQLADAVKTALAQRSDMKQLQLDLAAARITLELKKGQATPTVKVNAGMDWSHDWSASTDSLSVSAGLSIQAPIIDAGAGAAAVKQAEINAANLGIQQEQKTASITIEIKDDLASLRDLVARADLAQASLDLAQNEYDLTKVQFDSGVKSNLDVLAASVSLTTAQVNLAKARADAQLGVLTLQNALGN